MAISPWRVGQTNPILQFTLQDDDGAVPPGLPALASNYTFRIQNIRTGTVSAGAGTFTVVSTTQGQITYQVAAADCATPGKFRVWVEVQIGSNPLFTDGLDWVIDPA